MYIFNSHLIMFRDAKRGFGDRANSLERFNGSWLVLFLIKKLKVKPIIMLLLDFECYLFLLQLNGGSCMETTLPH